MGIVQLLFSFKPFAKATSDLANVQVTASAFVFVRPTPGPIAESGIDPSKYDLYVASEGDSTSSGALPRTGAPTWA